MDGAAFGAAHVFGHKCMCDAVCKFLLCLFHSRLNPCFIEMIGWRVLYISARNDCRANKLYEGCTMSISKRGNPYR